MHAESLIALTAMNDRNAEAAPPGVHSVMNALRRELHRTQRRLETELTNHERTRERADTEAAIHAKRETELRVALAAASIPAPPEALTNAELESAIAYAYECSAVRYTGGNTTSETEVGKTMIDHLKALLAIQRRRAERLLEIDIITRAQRTHEDPSQ